MKKLPLLVGLFAALVPVPAGADHLDGNQIARSAPEHTLAGIQVSTTSYRDFRSLHAGARLDENNSRDFCKPGSDCFGSGNEQVVWQEHGCEVTVFATFTGPKTKRVVSAVWVSANGKPSAHGKGCATGRGLAIGDPFEKAQSLYGNHFFLNRNDPNAKGALFEWKDGTQLDIDMDGNWRITKLNLDADVE